MARSVSTLNFAVVTTAGQTDAFGFFSKSGLTPETLGNIWSQANPQLSPVLSAGKHTVSFF
jgi:hypothetical protein